MEINPQLATEKASPDNFSGDVFADTIVRGKEPSRLRASHVHFTPGARTAWHAHALGQTLFVTAGIALAQARGGELLTIRPGDVVVIPPDEWHWHGAKPDHFMSHIAISEMTDDPGKKRIEWGEHVTDAEYGQA